MRTIDWLVIGIIVVIVLLLADGMRRKWRDRHNRVVMKIDRKNIPPPQDNDEEDPFPSSELPNGGARTKTRDGQAPASSARVTLTAVSSNRVAVDAEAAVPLLIDSVELEEEDIEHTNVYSSGEDAEQFDADEFDEAAEYQEDDFDDEDEEDWDEEAGEGNTAWQDGDDDEYEDDEDFEDEDDDFIDEEDDPGVAQPDDPYPDEDEQDGDFDEDSGEEGVEQEEDDEYEEADDEEDEDEDEDEDEEDDEDEEEDENDYEDDYENEPALLEGAYHKAATHFQRPEETDKRVEPGFDEEDFGEAFDPEEFVEDFSGAFEGDADEPGEHLHAETRVSAQARQPQPEPPREKRSFFARTLGRQDQAELFRQEAAVPEDAGKDEDEDEAPQEVIILNVMARPGDFFEGNELLPVLQEQGLRLGEMSIFHLHGAENGKQVLFSMANMVKPGTFDLAAMDDFTTPGVSFFLQLPNRNGNMASFDRMLRAATALKQALDGELKDEHRSVCTQQTIEHCRQRIRDFELARLTRR
jgi:cell division protein ZipA